MKIDFSDLIAGCNFYLAMFLGFRLYQSLVFPMCPIVISHESSLTAALPIYALNVLAYGCLVYVMTRPFAILLGRVTDQLLNPPSSQQ